MTDLCPAARTVQIDPICDARGNALTGQDVAGQSKARDRACKRGRQQGLYLVDIAVYEDFFEHEIGQGFVIGGATAQIRGPDKKGLTFEIILGFRRGPAELALHAFGQGTFGGFAQQACPVAKHFPIIRITIGPDRGPAIPFAGIQPQAEGAIIELLLRDAAVFAIRRNIGFQPDRLVAGIEIQIDFKIPRRRPFSGRHGVIELQNLGRENSKPNRGQEQRKQSGMCKTIHGRRFRSCLRL